MARVWSASRARLFQECARKYWYRYHLAKAGRRPGAGAEARTAHRVQSLMGVEMWLGTLVHEALEHTLDAWRHGRSYTEGEALDWALRRLRSQYRGSALYWREPEGMHERPPPLLSLHYFADEAPLTRQQGSEVRDRVEQCLRNFFRSDLAGELQALERERWLPIERHAAVTLEAGDSREALTLFVKPDCAFRAGDLLHILDWKTGRPAAHWERLQVAAYCLYAHYKWSHPLLRIRPRVVFLYPELRAVEVELDPAELAAVVDEIYAGAALIAGVEARAARGPEDVPAREAFPVTARPQVCRWCQFRELCQDRPAGAEAANPDGDAPGEGEWEEAE